MLEFQILQQRVSDLIHLNFKSSPSSPSLAFVHLTCAYVDFISSISPREMVQISPSILQDLIFSCPVQLIAMPNPLERVSYQIFLNSKIALTSPCFLPSFDFDNPLGNFPLPCLRDIKWGFTWRTPWETF